MERRGSEEMVDCADCGLPLDLGRDRGYRGHGDWALCGACALERGARFDEDEDCWIVPPDATGLAGRHPGQHPGRRPGQRDHRVR